MHGFWRAQVISHLESSAIKVRASMLELEQQGKQCASPNTVRTSVTSPTGSGAGTGYARIKHVGKSQSCMVLIGRLGAAATPKREVTVGQATRELVSQLSDFVKQERTGSIASKVRDFAVQSVFLRIPCTLRVVELILRMHSIARWSATYARRSLRRCCSL